jgi:uncharacterized protein YdaU (DUF1376 family)
MLTLDAVGAYTLLLFVMNETSGTVCWPIDAYARLWSTTEQRAAEIIDQFEAFNVLNVEHLVNSLSTADQSTNGQQTVNKASTKGQQISTKLTNRRMARQAEKNLHIKEVRSAAGKKSAERRQQNQHSSFSFSHISNSTQNHQNDSACADGNKKSAAKRTKKKNGEPFADKRQFTDHFTERYLAKVGTKYLFQSAKDGQVADRLLKIARLDELVELTDKFFASTDPWIAKAGYTLAVFESQVNKLAAGRPDVPAGWDSLKLWNDKMAKEGST